ncbi:hypothetical protein, partial [Gardnerella vaginalis]|uniref:hypothetical protein n=1 Tax=Gardnerella vaginalis TaxID=2702 RepID=UPI001CE39052
MLKILSEFLLKSHLGVSNELRHYRLRGLSARTSSPRRSSASALSGSALRIAFSRYALSEKAGRRARLFFPFSANMTTNTGKNTQTQANQVKLHFIAKCR